MYYRILYILGIYYRSYTYKFWHVKSDKGLGLSEENRQQVELAWTLAKQSNL